MNRECKKSSNMLANASNSPKHHPRAAPSYSQQISRMWLLSEVCNIMLWKSVVNGKHLLVNVIHPVFNALSRKNLWEIWDFYLIIHVRDNVVGHNYDPQLSAAPKPSQSVPINTSIPHQHQKQHNGLARGRNKPQKTVQNACLPVHFHSTFSKHTGWLHLWLFVNC